MNSNTQAKTSKETPKKLTKENVAEIIFEYQNIYNKLKSIKQRKDTKDSKIQELNFMNKLLLREIKGMEEKFILNDQKIKHNAEIIDSLKKKINQNDTKVTHIKTMLQKERIGNENSHLALKSILKRKKSSKSPVFKRSDSHSNTEISQKNFPSSTNNNHNHTKIEKNLFKFLDDRMFIFLFMKKNYERAKIS